jgi:WD40 repeat protein
MANTKALHIAFSPDGATLAEACGDGVVRMLDVKTGKVTATFTGGHRGAVYCVAFSKDGKTLATGGLLDHAISLWDVTSGKKTAILSKHTGTVFCVTFSKDGKCLASGSNDGTVVIWDIPAEK